MAMFKYELDIIVYAFENNLFRVKQVLTSINDNITLLNRFQGYRYESGIIIFA